MAEKDERIQLRLEKELLGRIDAWCFLNGASRSEAIRALVTQALDADKAFQAAFTEVAKAKKLLITKS